ncbi:MAG: hypothetical protein MN733_04955 [Nitrososphaera sp.]|nr:hypothetical protein [Nitrososphaera sp.]
MSVQLSPQAFLVIPARSRLLLQSALIVILFLSAVPLMFRGYAQMSVSQTADLRMAVHDAIIADPRSDYLSSAQITAIVDVLTQKAAAQGMTAHDLSWRPLLARAMAPADRVAASQADCGSVPPVFCSFNKAFGFSGSDPTLLIWVGVALTILLALIAGILEIRHYRRTRLEGSPVFPDQPKI